MWVVLQVAFALVVGSAALTLAPQEPATEVVNEEPQVVGPSPRSDFPAVVMGMEKVVIFGGKDKEKKMMDDLWGFDLNLNTWSELGGEGGVRPPGRCWHSMAIKPDNSKLYMFGGYDGKNDLNDLWRFAFSSGTWVQVVPAGVKPYPRDRHSMVMHGTGSLIVFGGYVGTYVNDMWSYSISENKWSQVVFESGPSKRRSHSAAMDHAHNRMYIFGGYDGNAYYSDLWEFDLTSNVWTELRGKVRPARRGGCGLVADVSGQLFMYGGFDGKAQKSDLWLHRDKDGWVKLNPNFERPEERTGFGSAMQISSTSTDKGRIYIVGGMGMQGPLNNIYKYEVASNQWRQLNVVLPAAV